MVVLKLQFINENSLKITPKKTANIKVLLFILAVYAERQKS